MKRNIWTAGLTTIAGFTAAAALAAQTTAPPPPQTQTPATPGSDTKITVTGCLSEASPNSTDAAGATGTAGTAGTTGTAGAAGTAAPTDAPQKFVLMDATRAPDATAKQTYQLIANPTALTPHVGKKLEMTGTLENTSASQDDTSGAGTNQPRLRVSSARVVADTCTAK